MVWFRVGFPGFAMGTLVGIELEKVAADIFPWFSGFLFVLRRWL